MFVQKTFKNDLPTLFLVGTPIGNLDDMSFRAVATLNEVDKILCEDTRTSLAVLKKYAVKKPLLSLHKFNEFQRLDEIKTLLNQGSSLAMISDAGVPMISDPGANLVHELRWSQNQVFNTSAVNVGPAYIHALVISGFNNPTNYFYGFIKNKSEVAKAKELEKVFQEHQQTSITFYESVHRIKQTINTLNEVLPPDTKLTLNRELTKINEEVVYGTVEELVTFVNSTEFVVKGEFVIVVDNQTKQASYDDASLLQLLETEVSQGLKIKEATKKVSEQTKANKNYLYNLYTTHKK